MQTISNSIRLAFILTALLAMGNAFADDPPTPLQARMLTMASGLKTVQTSLKTISGSPSANHDTDWAAAKTSAVSMAQAAGEAKTLFPPNVAGNAQSEAAFSAAIADLQATIQDQLINALDQKELADAQAAVQTILDKKGDGHDTFIPHT